MCSLDLRFRLVKAIWLKRWCRARCWKLTDTGFAPMAVKLSNGSRANNDMLLTEAAALQQLQGYSGTVQIDNCGEHKGCTFIVME